MKLTRKQFEKLNKRFNQHKANKNDLKTLAPYQVNNAIIMAAGKSSRFAPLCYKTPKGLVKVKGEILIERQIKQLLDVGIKDIIIVLGYKKEMYLKFLKKYPFIKVIINNKYIQRNNIESLYLARRFIRNTYICSCDDYFTINPFSHYEYEAYYAGTPGGETFDEFYMDLDKHGYIKSIRLKLKKGNIMFGHAYWNKTFSKAMLKLINAKHNSKKYSQKLWDVILMDYLKKLPPMYGKLYPNGVINEFDTVADLAKFDKAYDQ